MSGDLMSQTEAADELGLSRATVRKWADQLSRNAANGAA